MKVIFRTILLCSTLAATSAMGVEAEGRAILSDGYIAGETAGSSSNGVFIPLILLAIVAAAAAS